MLKGRFQCLKRLRFLLRDKQDMKRVLETIDVACILHNLCINDRIPEEWIEEEPPSADVQHNGAMNNPSVAQVSRRDTVYPYILEFSPY